MDLLFWIALEEILHRLHVASELTSLALSALTVIQDVPDRLWPKWAG